MRPKTLVPLALVAVVVVLVGANLALREDPEPNLGEPPPPASRPADEAAAEADAAEAGDREGAEGGAEGGEGALGDGPPGEGEGEGEVEIAESDGVVGCDHPLIAAERGQWRRYTWRQSTQERVAELRLRPRRTRELPSGEREVTWAVRVTAADDASQLAETDLTTRCAPGQNAEEPWFGILERSLGLRLTDDPGRWRWPAELSAGQRFEGTAHFDPRGSEMRAPDDAVGPQVLRVTRTHVVEGREPVEVPAGRFRAWKVVYEERHAFGERGEVGNGALWVAPGIGLVKSRAENSQGVVQILELAALGGAR
jgi:hypothetical protein